MLILLVEDNSMQRKILQRYLSGTDYTIIEAETAESAFHLLSKKSPDLIIADIVMPGMDGVEFVKRLKNENRYKHIPVIFLSSVSDYEIVVQALNSGASDYITKPFNREELLARLKLHLSLKISQDTILRQNEELRQVSVFNYNIIDNAGEGIAIYDNKLNYRVWNRALIRLTGLSAEEVVGNCATDVFPFIVEQGIDKLIMQSMNGERVVSPVHSFCIPHNSKSGWVRSVFVPNYDAFGEIDGVIAVVSDVTDLQEKEISLAKQSKFQQALFDNMNTPFCYGEVGGLSANDIRIVEYNREFHSIIKSALSLIPKELTIRKVVPCLSDKEIADLIEVASGAEPILFEFFSTQMNRFYQVKGYSPEHNRVALLFDDITDQKLSTIQILETEANFRKLFEAVPIPLVLSSLHSGEIQFANISACRLFGLDYNACLGLPVFRFYRVRSDRDLIIQELIANNSVYEKEIEMLTSNGEPLWIKNTSQVIKYKGVDLLFTALVDFTEHKRVLTELSESEAKYRLIAENMKDIVWQVDRELNLVYISPNNGYCLSDDVGNSLVTLDDIFINPSKVIDKTLKLAIQQYQAEGEIRDNVIELEMSDIKNEKKWLELEFISILDENGVIAGFQGLIKDISVRKNFQNATIETENKFKALAMASPDAIFITDLSLNIRFASNIYKRIFAYPEDNNPESFTELLDSSEINSFNSIVGDLTDGSLLQSEVFIGRKYTGEKMFIDVSLGLLEYNPYSAKELVLIVRDITERKKIEFQLIEAKNKAEEANKTKSEFIANTSHEIRTPLNVIMGYADILKQQLKDNKSYVDMISGIQKGADNLLSIINSILDLAKMESGHIRPAYSQFNLVQTIIDIKQIYSTQIRKKHLKYKVEIADNFPIQIISDDIKIRQIITNLMDNAVKFTEKGEITLSVNYKDKGNVIDLYLNVKDTGIGIDKKVQSTIFQAFRQHEGQSSRRYGGTGLGLTLTQKIVEMLNGKIELESRINEGTEFRIVLPNIRKAQLTNYEITPPMLGSSQFTVVIISSDLKFINEISTLLYQVNIPCLAYSDLNKTVLNSLEFKSLIIDYDSCKLIENRVNSMADYLKTDKSYVLTDNYKDLAQSAFKNINDIEIVNKGNISYICGELLELSAKYLINNTEIEELDCADLVELILKHTEDKDLDVIIQNLELEWRSTGKLMDIDDINLFAEKILLISDRIKNEELKIYGNMLAKQAANFELDVLRESFEAFEGIINKKQRKNN